VRSAPPLFRINGCGFGVYGKRDFDPETGTYVKTYCFCLLFIPVVALSAYRVADASRGWYFLGRVPLSGFARVWNVLLLAVALGLEKKRPGTAPDLLKQALARARGEAHRDPRGPLKVLEAVAPLARDSKDFTAARRDLLEKVVAREPNDPEPAVQLAVVY